MVAYDVCTGENEKSAQERTSSIGGKQHYMILL